MSKISYVVRSDCGGLGQLCSSSHSGVRTARRRSAGVRSRDTRQSRPPPAAVTTPEPPRSPANHNWSRTSRGVRPDDGVRMAACSPVAGSRSTMFAASLRDRYVEQTPSTGRHACVRNAERMSAYRMVNRTVATTDAISPSELSAWTPANSSVDPLLSSTAVVTITASRTTAMIATTRRARVCWRNACRTAGWSNAGPLGGRGDPVCTSTT